VRGQCGKKRGAFSGIPKIKHDRDWCSFKKLARSRKRTHVAGQEKNNKTQFVESNRSRRTLKQKKKWGGVKVAGKKLDGGKSKKVRKPMFEGRRGGWGGMVSEKK